MMSSSNAAGMCVASSRPAGSEAGVWSACGGLLDVGLLVAVMDGAGAVVTTAAGYSCGGRNAHVVDTLGNADRAVAARRAGIRWFVLTGIFTGDR